MTACVASLDWTDEDYLDLDPGIRDAVRILRRGGVETFESCQGGYGHPENPGGKHAYAEPTVRWHGTSADGGRRRTIRPILGSDVLRADAD